MGADILPKTFRGRDLSNAAKMQDDFCQLVVSLFPTFHSYLPSKEQEIFEEFLRNFWEVIYKSRKF